MYKNTFILFLVLGSLAAAALILLSVQHTPVSEHDDPVPSTPEPVACTTEAKMCPDGSFVGRTGPSCEFSVCPATSSIPTDVAAAIEAKADLITTARPEPGTVADNPLAVSGQARGFWYFEGSFPLVVTDWEGRIIGEGFATAQGEWMTEEFVPFIGTVSYELPSSTLHKTGTLILKKDNPSGLPEHDDALELPISFE